MRRFEMYPTIITPYRADGEIDFVSYRRLVELFARCGCDGIFAVCLSSEMFDLSDDEKLALASETISICRARGMKCVVSGHTHAELDAQIAYLKRLEALAPDAIILVSNRLAREGEGDDIALSNLKSILGALNAHTKLGIYECPHPYGRPLTPALINFMAHSGRFEFIKDTSCDIDVIRERLKLIDGRIGLYNANIATLEDSLDAGAAGFSGILLNIIPEMFSLLKAAHNSGDAARGKHIMRHIVGLSAIEGQNYPVNAKYLMIKRGAIETTYTRAKAQPLTRNQANVLDAFMEVNLRAYYALLPRAPYTLISEYDAQFNSCHASTLLPLSSGRVLVAYFAGTREGADDVAIWLSIYDGEWRKPRNIAKIEHTAHWNPVLFETREGVRLIFKAGREISNWVSYTMLSSDEGDTWTKPERVSFENPAGGPVRGKPIQLSDGALLAPNSDESEAGWYPRVDISLDGGRTFEKLSDIPINRIDASRPDYMCGIGAIQPALWQSESGEIHALLRTDAGKLYKSDSRDGGKSWLTAYPTPLPNNNSAIDIERVGDTLYLALNPVDAPWGPRTPLIIMRSDDDGRTFSAVAVLAHDIMDDYHKRDAQFAYPALVARDGWLYISFTHNRKAIAFAKIALPLG